MRASASVPRRRSAGSGRRRTRYASKDLHREPWMLTRRTPAPAQNGASRIARTVGRTTAGGYPGGFEARASLLAEHEPALRAQDRKMTLETIAPPPVALLSRIIDRAFAQTMAMIHAANQRPDKRRGDPKVGGHPASCASSIHILGALNFFAREPQDFVCC